ELLLPSGNALTIYRFADDAYRADRTLGVPWAAGSTPEPITMFAAIDARPPAPPTRAFPARIAVGSREWWAFGRYDRPAERIQHRWERQLFAGDAPTMDGWTEPLPHYLQPCCLNDDPTPDFAGADWHMDPGILAPTPIFEISATLDAGETIRRVRTRGFRSGCWFTDVDGDGDADLIAESSSLARGGIRESIAKLLWASDVAHEVRVYHQAEGRFDERPSRVHEFGLDMETAPYKMSPFFRRYRLGELVNVTGDFNGDGQNDYLVHHRPDEAVIYLYSGPRDITEAARVQVLPGDRIGLVDLNGDGLTDLVIQSNAATPDAAPPARVLLASPAPE
ncbi:MAG: VCBS repeat-containing protein, partial [Candidatus Hydrogenedentales bacterium]